MSDLDFETTVTGTQRVASELDTLQGKVGGVDKATEKLNATTGKGATSVGALTTNFGQFGGALGSVGQAFGRTNPLAGQLFSTLGQGTGVLQTLGSGMGTLGVAMAGVTLVFGLVSAAAKEANANLAATDRMAQRLQMTVERATRARDATSESMRRARVRREGGTSEELSDEERQLGTERAALIGQISELQNPQVVTDHGYVIDTQRMENQHEAAQRNARVLRLQGRVHELEAQREEVRLLQLQTVAAREGTTEQEEITAEQGRQRAAALRGAAEQERFQHELARLSERARAHQNDVQEASVTILGGTDSKGALAALSASQDEEKARRAAAGQADAADRAAKTSEARVASIDAEREALKRLEETSKSVAESVGHAFDLVAGAVQAALSGQRGAFHEYVKNLGQTEALEALKYTAMGIGAALVDPPLSASYFAAAGAHAAVAAAAGIASAASAGGGGGRGGGHAPASPSRIGTERRADDESGRTIVINMGGFPLATEQDIGRTVRRVLDAHDRHDGR